MISKDQLVQLYINENKTDKEIASIYGVTHGTISLWRKKYSIKGINASHRKFFDNPQIELSQRQQSIILGTLLGDGCLKTSNVSSYLTISHTYKQKEYLFWLYEELKSICPTAPKSYISKGKYETWYFASESRKDLKEINDKIYTPKKAVNKWWADQIDELALAIWFMDDGTLSYINKKRSDFSFATNSFSEEENYLLASVLKTKFDIDTSVKPLNKKSGLQYNLYIHDNSFDKFSNLIDANVVPSMRYKLPSEAHRYHLQSNIKVGINKLELNRLYHEEELTCDQIARKLDVHKSTVIKYMDIFDIKARSQSLAQLKGKNNKSARERSGRFVTSQLDESKIQVAEKLYSELRSSGFPYMKVKDDDHYLGIIDKMYNKEIGSSNEDGIFAYSRAGVEISSSLCPQIFSMAAEKALTPIEIFNNNEMLMDCIKRTIRYAKKETIAAVRSGLKTYKKNRCVTIFPPMWCKTAILESFKGREDLSVLDFSCGFGGRLIGSYASTIVSKYIGIDPLIENINSHKAINGIIQKHSILKKNPFDAVFINGTAEDVLPTLNSKFDLIITSPPYFSKERYSGGNTQCYIKYPEYEAWKKKWLKEVLEKSYDLLSANGKMIIFASDNAKFPIGADCKDIMKVIGGQNPKQLNFSQPTVEYLRKNNNKKIDTAWVISKL